MNKKIRWTKPNKHNGQVNIKWEKRKKKNRWAEQVSTTARKGVMRSIFHRGTYYLTLPLWMLPTLTLAPTPITSLDKSKLTSVTRCKIHKGEGGWSGIKIDRIWSKRNLQRTCGCKSLKCRNECEVMHGERGKEKREKGIWRKWKRSNGKNESKWIWS